MVSSAIPGKLSLIHRHNSGSNSNNYSNNNSNNIDNNNNISIILLTIIPQAHVGCEMIDGQRGV